MSINLLDVLESDVTSQLLEPAASFLDASITQTESALKGIMPSILGAFINRVSSEDGVADVFGMLNNVDDGILDEVSGIFESGHSGISNIIAGGGDMLSTILGDDVKITSLVDVISRRSGLNSGHADSLAKLATPFIVGAIGRKVKSLALDAFGFSNLLLLQKANVKSELPDGVINVLGFGDLLEATKSSLNNELDLGKRGVNNLIKWLLPVLLALLIIGWLGKKGCSFGVGAIHKSAGAATTMATGAITTSEALANKAIELRGEALISAFVTVDAAAKASLDGIQFVSGSVGDQLNTFIKGGLRSDNKFTFRNLTFAIGSADLDMDSRMEVEQLAAILKAYTSVKIAIEGYTDNTGDSSANIALSAARAESISSALIENGIDAARIVASGFGSADPIGDNQTQEGRAQNRRIELRIIQ